MAARAQAVVGTLRVRDRLRSDEAGPWRRPLLGALALAAGLTLLTIIDFKIGAGTHADASGLNAFWWEGQGHVQLEQTISNTVDLVPFLFCSAVLAVTAGHVRRPALLAAMSLLLAGANVSTELFKLLMPGHDPVAYGIRIQTIHSYPSGHATAIMSLVLCLVIMAPCSGRGWIAGIGALYATVLGYALVFRSVHFPSDVLAGYLMASVWALIAIGSLRALEARGARWADRRRRAPAALDRRPLVLAAVVAAAGVAVVTIAKAGAPQTKPATFFAFATLLALVAAGVVLLTAGMSAE